MASEMTDRPIYGRPMSAWSPPFKSQLALFFGIGSSSAGSLARYVPGILSTQKMLIVGSFFGFGLALLVYAAIKLRSLGKRPQAVSRRERSILFTVAGFVVLMLLARGWLYFHGG